MYAKAKCPDINGAVCKFCDWVCF